MQTYTLTGDYNIHLMIDSKEYQGVFLKQWDEDGKKYVMTFTALDDETGVAVWCSGLNALEE